MRPAKAGKGVRIDLHQEQKEVLENAELELRFRRTLTSGF